MTWLGDRQKLPEAEQNALKTKREKLVEQVQALQKKAGTHKTVSAANFWKEDLTELARQIGVIDRKLGRV